MQPLGTLSRAERDTVTEEAVRMLSVMAPPAGGTDGYDIRFATFLDSNERP